MIRFYEYKEYSKNDTLEILKSSRYRKVCESFGKIYTLKDSVLNIEDLYSNQRWIVKNNTDSIYNYTLERITENNLTEICNTNILIPFTPLNTLRCKDGIIVKNIYEKNEQIFDTLTGIIEPIYLFVEEMPQFSVGDLALKKTIVKNLDYNFYNYECSISSTVFVSFVITKRGYVRNVYIVRGSNQEMDEVAFYAVSKLPRFVPGKQNGENVNVWYTVPVKFELY